MNDFAINVLTAPLGKTYLFAVGQAGFIIKSAKGELFGFDMYLSDCVERIEGHIGFKRLMPKILSPDELKFDLIVATHPHVDHFDIDALPLMAGGKTKIFSSVCCEELADKLMMSKENMCFVKPGDVFKEGSFTLQFVNSDHGAGAPDAVGVVVTVDNKRIYFAGDTCLHTEYRDFATDIDVMIAPINGAYGNLNAEECCELSKAVCPKLTVPCHFGMFASHGGNPQSFKECMEKEKLPFIFMTPSEMLEL